MQKKERETIVDAVFPMMVVICSNTLFVDGSDMEEEEVSVVEDCCSNN